MRTHGGAIVGLAAVTLALAACSSGSDAPRMAGPSTTPETSTSSESATSSDASPTAPVPTTSYGPKAQAPLDHPVRTGEVPTGFPLSDASRARIKASGAQSKCLFEDMGCTVQGDYLVDPQGQMHVMWMDTRGEWSGLPRKDSALSIVVTKGSDIVNLVEMNFKPGPGAPDLICSSTPSTLCAINRGSAQGNVIDLVRVMPDGSLPVVRKAVATMPPNQGLDWFGAPGGIGLSAVDRQSQDGTQVRWRVKLLTPEGARVVGCKSVTEKDAMAALEMAPTSLAGLKPC